MPKKLYPQLCLAVATSWILLVAGCGPALVTIEGTVTWDGAPVETGTISFLPADGKGPTIGGELKDGGYRIKAEKQAALGAKSVAITGIRKTGKMIEAGPPAPAGTMVDELLRVSSTESCEIVAGENKHDFQLKSGVK
jgi:hypothetical protein